MVSADFIYIIAGLVGASIIIGGSLTRPEINRGEATQLKGPSERLVLRSLRGKGMKLNYKPTSPKVTKSFTVGDLECRSILGSGGSAVTFLSIDRHGKPHVIKLPHEILKAIELGSGIPTLSGSVVENLKREAELMQRLDHPNILKVEGFGLRVPHLVMEFCEQGSLRGVLNESGKLAPREALEIFVQIADALAYLHNNSIIHRDIKPENILFTKDGVPKLCDFNISKVLTSASTTGSMSYTRGYAAPEQLFADLGPTDQSTDIWSFGIVLYEALCGALPFSPDNYEDEIRAKKIGSIEGVPSSINELLLKALNFDRSKRHRNAQEMRDEMVRSYLQFE